MRTLVLSVCLVLIAALTATAPSDAETVQLGDRWYQIDLPANPKGAPLILALHGGGGDPGQFARSSGFAEAATRAGFAVVFPAGSGRGGNRLLTWNVGYCCGYAARQKVDDIAFLKQVIDDAAARFKVDGHAVFLTGMSNGSMLAETFAAGNPGLVRAVAGVSGSMDTDSFGVRGQVPLLIIHGTADQNVPYDGGVGEASWSKADYASVPSVVRAFLAPWGSVSESPPRQIDRKDDGTSVTVTDYAKGPSVVLRLITITGGSHHWPGSRTTRQREGKTQDIDANTEILRFFALYR